MKKLGIFGSVVLVALVATVAALVLGAYAGAGGGKTNVTADTLVGYQETPGVSSAATGSFSATIDDDAETIDYTLSYSGLEGSVLFAHIHFGNRFDAGGIAAFLCGGGSKPACPQEGTVTGTITPADVIGPTGQGIAPGEFDQLVAAMRAGETYANVHSSPTFGAGEIRGQINDDDQRQP